MSKICPICNREWPDEFLACPLDGTTLVVKPHDSGFNLNLGDANAISGGVNMSDNHSVTHNTDSHNVITNNITHVEREKSREERLLESKQTFREACKQAFSNGMCTSEEKRRLDDLRFELGLDDETSSQIFENARMSVQRKSVVLGPIQKMTFERVRSAILCNDMVTVQKLYPQLVAMVQKFAVEELQYTYYMLQTVFSPDLSVKDYESHKDDKYWQTFWTAVAYRKLGDIVNSESLLVDVGSKWTDTIPEENAFVLAVVCALLDGDHDTAKNLFAQVTGDQSPYLESLVGCLYGILYDGIDASDEVRCMIESGKFYRENLFPLITKPCVKNEASDMKSNVPSFSRNEAGTSELKKQETVLMQPQFDESLFSSYLNEFGYLRQLSSEEIITAKQQLALAAEENHNAQFYLGQLILQEDDSPAAHLAAWKAIKFASEHGVYEAGAYMAYFYLYGKVVTQDFAEAERRIKIDEDYKKNPVFVQMLVDLYDKQGNNFLSDVWKTKLRKLNHK